MMMQSSHCFFKNSQLVKVCSNYLPEAYADCVAASQLLRIFDYKYRQLAKTKNTQGLSVRGIVRKIDISLLALRRIR